MSRATRIRKFIATEPSRCCRSRHRCSPASPTAQPRRANRRRRGCRVVIPTCRPPWLDEPPAGRARDLPLRFMWQMDREGRFSLGSDEFTRLIGPRTAAGFGRPWSEIAETFGLDPDGRVAKAVATGAPGAASP